MTAVAGVDGGGTRTRALVVDADGAVLGRGQGPAGIVEPGAVERSAEAVAAAVEAAREAAGLEGPLDALWAGLAGAGRAEARARAREALEGRGLARRVEVGTDVEAAYRDAFDDGGGVLLVAGTGSMALAREPGGDWIRVGGWGALLGDEGSGYWIGVRALRAVLAAHDGRGPETRMRGPALEAFGVSGPEALVEATADAPKARIAALAGAVAGAADAGDPVARTILSAAVDALVAHLAAVRDRLEASGPHSLALTGGLLAPGRPLRRRLVAAVDADAFRVRPAEVRAERGAAALALALAGSAGG